MRAGSASARRAALKRPDRKRVPQVVQTRATPRRRHDACLAHEPVERLLDGDVAHRASALADGYGIILRTRSAARQIAPQTLCCRVVKRHQSRLAELGLADHQPVRRDVSDGQLQRFEDPQAGGREQSDQRGIRLRAQAFPRPKLQGNLNQAVEFRGRIDMRRSSSLARAEVMGWRQLVPVILDPDMAHEAADGLQSGIALCNGGSERCPVDGRLRVNM